MNASNQTIPLSKKVTQVRVLLSPLSGCGIITRSVRCNLLLANIAVVASVLDKSLEVGAWHIVSSPFYERQPVSSNGMI